MWKRMHYRDSNGIQLLTESVILFGKKSVLPSKAFVSPIISRCSFNMPYLRLRDSIGGLRQKKQGKKKQTNKTTSYTATPYDT